MTIIHWTSPEGEKWKAHAPRDFDGDLYFAFFPSGGGLLESFTTCSYVRRIVQEEYTRPKKKRRKELALAARDLRGKPAILHIPYELLEAVVAKGFVFPYLFRWFWNLGEENLIRFLPLAQAGSGGRKIGKTLLKRTLENLAGLDLSKPSKDLSGQDFGQDFGQEVGQEVPEEEKESKEDD